MAETNFIGITIFTILLCAIIFYHNAVYQEYTRKSSDRVEWKEIKENLVGGMEKNGRINTLKNCGLFSE